MAVVDVLGRRMRLRGLLLAVALVTGGRAVVLQARMIAVLSVALASESSARHGNLVLRAGSASASIWHVPVAVSAPAGAQPYAPAQLRADASVALVAQSAVGFAMLALQGAFGPPITVPVRTPVAFVAAVAIGGGTLLAVLGLLGAAIAVPMWIHRCYRNLPALGSRGHLSPAWAAACWFVPVANLVLPYLAVREVWIASTPRGRLTAPLVAAWWVVWLAAWALRLVNGLLPWPGYAEILSATLMAISGALFVSIVHLITRGQRERAASSHEAPAQ